VPLFHAIDFIVNMNRNVTIRIALKDNSQQWLTPPFNTGYFAIAPLAIPPILQNTVTPVFQRNTNGFNVRFTNLIDPPDTSGPEWVLDCDILPADTISLNPGVYYYEARLDFSGGQYSLKSGLFRLNLTIL
jgi:hypothetical protein